MSAKPTGSKRHRRPVKPKLNTTLDPDARALAELMRTHDLRPSLANMLETLIFAEAMRRGITLETITTKDKHHAHQTKRRPKDRRNRQPNPLARTTAAPAKNHQ